MATDPDLVMGHNLHVCMEALGKRCTALAIPSVIDVGRAPNKTTHFRRRLCKSAARGNEVQTLWLCSGRVTLDTYQWARRELKLARHGITYVAEKLGFPASVESAASVFHHVLHQSTAMRIVRTDSNSWCEQAMKLTTGLFAELPLAVLLRCHTTTDVYDAQLPVTLHTLTTNLVATFDAPDRLFRLHLVALAPILAPYIDLPDLVWELPGSDTSFLKYDPINRALTGHLDDWPKRMHALQKLQLEYTNCQKT